MLLHCVLLDVVCSGDEHVTLEQEIGDTALRRHSDQFNDYGVLITSDKLLHVDSVGDDSDDDDDSNELHTRARRRLHCKARTWRCAYSPSASKLNKYKPYATYIERTLGFASCTVQPLVFGVRGFVPMSTYNALASVIRPRPPTKESATKQLLTSIMHVIFRCILVSFRAWKSAEGASQSAAS